MGAKCPEIDDTEMFDATQAAGDLAMAARLNALECTILPRQTEEVHIPIDELCDMDVISAKAAKDKEEAAEKAEQDRLDAEKEARVQEEKTRNKAIEKLNKALNKRLKERAKEQRREMREAKRAADAESAEKRRQMAGGGEAEERGGEGEEADGEGGQESLPPVQQEVEGGRQVVRVREVRPLLSVPRVL